MAYGFKTTKSWLYGLLGVFVILGLTYGLTVPLFESSDEFSHLQVTRYIASEMTLPPPVFPDRRADSGEAMAQFLTFHDPPWYYAPPLYHALGAALTFWSSMEDLPVRLIPNPAWAKGWSPESTTDPWNKNIYVHLPDETLAQSATVRAALFLRLVSLLLACVPIVCAYHIALLLWPERPVMALIAAGFVALNPQYIATAASVTNDLLLCALFSLAVWAMVKAIVDQGWGWRRWALLGSVVGLAVLVKQSALLLLPLGGLAIVWQTPGPVWRGWRKWLVDGAAFGLAALCVGGWWYALNGLRYGDLLGTATHVESQVALAGFDLQAALSTFRSYWAAFGWGIPAPGWFYWLMGGVVAVALLGMVKSCVATGLITLRLRRSKPCPRGGLGTRARSPAPETWAVSERAPLGEVWRLALPVRRSLIFLGGVSLLNGLAFVRWAVFTGAPFGRLLFPSIAAMGVLWVWGIGQLFRGKALRRISLGWGVGMVCFAAWVPWGLLRPAYASPYRERLPQGVIAQDVTFADGLHFVGYTEADQALFPGDSFRVTLYWQAEQSPTELYTVWSQLGPQDPTRYIAGDHRWLGGTLYPSHLWEDGDIVQHALDLEIPAWTPAPALYWLRFGLVDEQQRLTLPDGGDVITLGPWRVRSATASAAPTHTVDYRLGEAIVLSGYDVTIDETVSVTLTWQAKATPHTDYTVFVHLMDEHGTVIAQDDDFPAAGAYPTSWWLPGDVIQDHHTLTPAEMPQTALYFRVGLYERASAQRLPVYAADGERLSDDVIELYPCEGCE